MLFSTIIIIMSHMHDTPVPTTSTVMSPVNGIGISKRQLTEGATNLVGL